MSVAQEETPGPSQTNEAGVSQVFVGREGEAFGPFSEEEARRLFGSGQIVGSDLVWRRGMSNWAAAPEVLGESALASPPVRLGATSKSDGAGSPGHTSEECCMQCGAILNVQATHCPSCSKPVLAHLAVTGNTLDAHAATDNSANRTESPAPAIDRSAAEAPAVRAKQLAFSQWAAVAAIFIGAGVFLFPKRDRTGENERGLTYVRAGGFICDHPGKIIGQNQLRNLGMGREFQGCERLGANISVNILDQDRTFGAVLVGNAGGTGWVDPQDLVVR